MRLWDATSGELLASLRGHEGWVGSVAYSPDGKRIASVGRHGNIKIWDAHSGRGHLTLTGHGRNVAGLVIVDIAVVMMSSSWL